MQLISKISSASVENYMLACVPDGERLREAYFSPDGTAVAFITSKGAEHSVRNANGTPSAYADARNVVVGHAARRPRHGAPAITPSSPSMAFTDRLFAGRVSLCLALTGYRPRTTVSLALATILTHRREDRST